MFKVRVIPCLDVKDGRVVKGVNFVNLRDAGDPVELAAAYDAAGADELVFLDVTASSDERATMLDVVRRTAESVFIPLTVGGGVRTIEDFRALLRAGADRVAINTAAIRNPQLIADCAREFGVQAVVLSCERYLQLRPEGSATTACWGEPMAPSGETTWPPVGRTDGRCDTKPDRQAPSRPSAASRLPRAAPHGGHGLRRRRRGVRPLATQELRRDADHLPRALL